MNIIRKVVDFINDDEMKLTITANKIYVVNYIEILRFTDRLIIVKYNKGKITIEGQELMITKLLNNELLVTGVIKKIEIGDNYVV